ncbi:hypothetical protein DMENIID0001_003510 [Sergentomyia squamirostris]
MYCEYVHYKMIDEDFTIKSNHMKQYRNVLVKHGGIEKAKAQKLDQLIQSCAKMVKISGEMEQEKKCAQITKYYQCIVVESQLLDYNQYAKAMIEYDATVELKP